MAADVAIGSLADRTEGYTGADIASVISASLMLAIKEHLARHSEPKDAEAHAEELKVSLRHIEEAMKKIRPLSKQELDWYRRVAEQFGKPPVARVEGPRVGIT